MKKLIAALAITLALVSGAAVTGLLSTGPAAQLAETCAQCHN